MSSDSPVCNAGKEGRSWQDTAGVVNGTLLIFTGPRGPGIANSSHGAKTSTETQSQGLGGESVHRSWKPFALMATATGDLKCFVILPLHPDFLVIHEAEQATGSQEFYLLR